MGNLLPLCPSQKLYLIQSILLQLVVFTAITVACIPYLNKLLWCCFRRVCNRQLWNKQWLQNKVDAVVERVFDRILTKHGSEEEGNVYTVMNYKAPHSYTNLLFLTFIILIISAIVQFWDDFLLEESYECSTETLVCCYSGSSKFDCSNATDKNNNPVICLKFVLKLGTATGSTLGIIGTIVLTIFAITWCLLKIFKGSRRGWWRALLTVFFQVTATLIVLAATMVLCNQRMMLYPGFSTKHLEKLAEIYHIGLLISIYIVFFPWRKFVKNDDIQEYNPLQA